MPEVQLVVGQVMERPRDIVAGRCKPWVSLPVSEICLAVDTDHGGWACGVLTAPSCCIGKQWRWCAWCVNISRTRLVSRCGGVFRRALLALVQ